jgi:hypothetical protein
VQSLTAASWSRSLCGCRRQPLFVSPPLRFEPYDGPDGHWKRLESPGLPSGTPGLWTLDAVVPSGLNGPSARMTSRPVKAAASLCNRTSTLSESTAPVPSLLPSRPRPGAHPRAFDRLAGREAGAKVEALAEAGLCPVERLLRGSSTDRATPRDPASFRRAALIVEEQRDRDRIQRQRAATHCAEVVGQGRSSHAIR